MNLHLVLYLLVPLHLISLTTAFQSRKRIGTSTRCASTSRGRCPASGTRSSSSALALISLDDSLATQIAFFPTKDSEHQQNFVNVFQSTLLPVVMKQPGFASCHMYTSLDGSRVALYEQWQSIADCQQSYGELSLATAVRKSLKFVLDVDDRQVDRHLYKVVATTSTTTQILLNDPSGPWILFAIFPTAATSNDAENDELQALVSQSHQRYVVTQQPPPELLSASIHKSLDGSQVVNFVQWRDTAAAGLPQNEQEAYWNAVTDNNQHQLYQLACSC